MPSTIVDYVKEQETAFETQQVQIGDNWLWSFRYHVQIIFHLKNGIFFTGENKWLRAFKNIMEPILNLAYWSEDIEVKDVIFYEDEGSRINSFLIKKYHDEVYVKENNLDTLFDEITECDVDFGGVLVQETNTPKPEVLELQSIAFCDQTDILGAPIAFKLNFAPEKLRAMKKNGWGSEKNGATISIEDLIVLADANKTPAGMPGKPNKSTGKSVEVYIIRGSLPEHYLKDNDDMETYCYQLEIVALYTDKDSNKQGVILYRKEEDEDKILFHTSKKVYGRALGRGVGETLLHPQIWTNFLEIHKMNMLEAGSKVPLYTDDPTYTQKNRIQDMENLEITTIEDNKRIYQVPTVAPANVQLLDKAINEFYEHAQLAGAAFDPLMGKEQVSGTTFRGQERAVQQGKGPHDRKRGQRAKFIEEIYRKMIIPKMKKEILKGKKFLAELSMDELSWVTEQLVTNQTNQMVKDKILNGELITQEEIDAYKQLATETFKKKGNKHLLEILKGEMEGIEIKMGINIAGKQKDLAGLSDKVLSIFQFVLGNPQIQQTMQAVPGLAKSFNDIMEYSGISPVDFATFTTMQPQMAQEQQMQPQKVSQVLPSPIPSPV